MIKEDTDEKIETLEELTVKSLVEEIRFITEDEKSPRELLTEFIYEDFVKAR
jgi:hypothetical protein